jgi:hypothetical protein
MPITKFEKAIYVSAPDQLTIYRLCNGPITIVLNLEMKTIDHPIDVKIPQEIISTRNFKSCTANPAAIAYTA